MPSYQDIENRLRGAEEKIQFIFDNFKLTKQTILPILDEQGRQQVSVETITLGQAYRDLKNGSLEPVNGSSEPAGSVSE